MVNVQCSMLNVQCSMFNDMRYGGDDIDAVIMEGITFRGGAKGGPKKQEAKVRTKAKKKQYITGAHGSGSAKKKADIRRQRANRHK